MVLPAAGHALPGGLLQVEVQPDSPDTGGSTCVFASIDGAVADGPVGEPRDQDHACAGPGTAAQTIFLGARDARGTLTLESGDQVVDVPYVVPKGGAAQLWVGKEDGVLKVGTAGTLVPWEEPSRPWWGAVQGLGFLSCVVMLALAARALWFGLAWVPTVLASLLVSGQYGNMDAVPIAAVLLLGLVGAAFAVLRVLPSAIGKAPSTAVAQDAIDELPKLDAIGLREDLR